MLSSGAYGGPFSALSGRVPAMQCCDVSGCDGRTPRILPASSRQPVVAEGIVAVVDELPPWGHPSAFHKQAHGPSRRSQSAKVQTFPRFPAQ